MIKLNATLVDDYEYVSRNDDAVDSDAADFDERWQKYMDGMGECPVKHGCEPSRFTMRHIGSLQKASLSEHLSRAAEDASQWQSACFEVARVALVGCKGLKDLDGSDFKVKRHKVDGIMRVSEETLNKLPYELLIELGAVAISKMAPRPS